MLFVHYGEEHVNDPDGPILLPKIVEESRKFRPDMVALSGDKVNDGTPEQLQLWRDAMEPYDRAGIPYFAAVGNHDRLAPISQGPGVAPTGDLTPYMEIFADRPYPWGDARGYGRPFSPNVRPPDDPEGASSHYFVDVGRSVRWIFIDNSCHSIIFCDLHQQNPSAQNRGGTEGQFDFMRRVAREGKAAGRLVFVVMHIPTRDPGDQLYREPIALQHTMGKEVLGTLDNRTFEQTAAEGGVDAVLVGHIKGQFTYRAAGIPYFINGGAGGALYSTGPEGVDHGYWHGFHLFRVHRGEIVASDHVPIFRQNGIRIEGPRTVGQRERVTFEAFGDQPVEEHEIHVDRLELRDPDPTPRFGGSSAAFAWLPEGGIRWLLPLAGALLIGLAGPRLARALRRRRILAPTLLAGGLAGIALAGVALAQQSEPTATRAENLPSPARMFTTENRLVLAPVAAPSDDRRRHRRTQTKDGTFVGMCPGRTRLRVASGFESRTIRVRVPGEPGRALRRVAVAPRPVRAGRAMRVGRVRVAERARVRAIVRRGGRRVARLVRTCHRNPERALPLRWDGRDGAGRPAPSGRYRLAITVNGGPGDRTRVHRRIRVR